MVNIDYGAARKKEKTIQKIHGCSEVAKKNKMKLCIFNTLLP